MTWTEAIRYARMMARERATRYRVGGHRDPYGTWRYGAYPAVNR